MPIDPKLEELNKIFASFEVRESIDWAVGSLPFKMKDYPDEPNQKLFKRRYDAMKNLMTACIKLNQFCEDEKEKEA